MNNHGNASFRSNERLSRPVKTWMYELALPPGFVASNSDLQGHPYAPLQEGSLHIQLRTDDHIPLGNSFWESAWTREVAETFTTRERWVKWRPQNEKFYIPVCFLWALAKNDFPWPEGISFRDGRPLGLYRMLAEAPSKENKELALKPIKFSKENDQLLKGRRKGTKGKYFYGWPGFTNPTNKQLWMPARSQDGKLIMCLFKKSYKWNTGENANQFRNEFAEYLKSIDGPPAFPSTAPPRYDNTVLTKGLHIVVAQKAVERFASTNSTAKQIFENAVKKINDSNAKFGALIGQRNPPIKSISLAVKDPNSMFLDGSIWVDGIPAGYKWYSANPFDLYDTYVHEDDWDDYMKGLRFGCTDNENEHPDAAVRTLPDINTQKWEKYVDQSELFKNVQTRAEDRELPVGGPQAGADKNAKDEEKRGRIRNGYGGKSNGWTQSIVIPISTRKILDASGKRDENDDQNEVMGGADKSASKIAGESREVAGNLGWMWRELPQPMTRMTPYKRFEMANSRYIAEWLHLSAFSWGGLMKYEMENQESSSQLRHNLILGTSETNSLMTRYERAWQQLFKHEHELAGMPTDNKRAIKGTLAITKNPVNKGGDPYPFLHDVWVRDAGPNGRYVREKVELDPRKREISLKYPWMVYSIEYGIQLQPASKILHLGKGEAGCVVRFYPFQRPFFHKAEHDLDAALYSAMYDDAVMRKDSDVTKDNRPVTTIPQTDPTGTLKKSPVDTVLDTAMQPDVTLPPTYLSKLKALVKVH